MAAYYNENDPFAATWLRELVKAKLIPEGDVDERSIAKVEASDLAGFTQCHFFAGVGVWPYALRLAGVGDDRPGVWTGSCPCQPFSDAGKAAGTEDPRHLWPEWFRLVGQCRPAIVLGEQVASKAGLGWLDLVRADMERAGYAVGAADLCAAGVGAPHIRQRLWFVGKRLEHAAGDGRRERRAEPGQRRFEPRRGDGGLADGLDPGPQGRLPGRPDTGREGQHGYAGRDGAVVGLANNDQDGRQLLASSRLHDQWASGDDAVRRREHGRLADAAVDGGPQVGAGVDALDQQRQAVGRRPVESAGAGADGGTGGGGDSAGNGKGRADDSMARVARPGADDRFWVAADWLYCRDGRWRPVEPGTFPLAAGIAGRVGRLRGYGNSLVAPLAAAFIETVMEVL